MPALDHDALTELLTYALLKTPHMVRQDLAASEPERQRVAEALLADRILSDMRHLEVRAPAGHHFARAGRDHPSLPLPITEADLPY